MTVSLEALDPLAAYCVMRDPVLHESIVVTGYVIRSTFLDSRDFKHYSPVERVPEYVHLDCGDFCLAIWRDPTRPELNVRDEPGGVAVEAGCSMAECLQIENEHAAELAADYARQERGELMDEILGRSARSLLQKFYV